MGSLRRLGIERGQSVWFIVIFLEANSFELTQIEDRKQRAEPLLAQPVLWTWAARKEKRTQEAIDNWPLNPASLQLSTVNEPASGRDGFC